MLPPALILNKSEFCAQSVLMCLAKSEEKTAIISFKIINWSW